MKRPELRAGAATQPQAGGERLCHPQGGLLRLLRRLRPDPVRCLHPPEPYAGLSAGPHCTERGGEGAKITIG